LKKAFIVASLAGIVCTVILICFYYDLQNYASSASAPPIVEKIITIRQGQGFAAVSETIFHAGIIHNPSKFKLLARLRGHDKDIKAGEYRLSSSMSPSEILETIVEGKFYLHRLTIPEGSNLYQVASLVSMAGLCTESEFITAATDASLLRKLGLEAETFEGYLFPDTYYFQKGAPPDSIIKTMVRRFRIVFKPEWSRAAGKLGLSVHQVLTLASIIEKETGAAFERPIISSVFHNRLKKGMRLETDPTVIYGIKNFDGNLTRNHLETPTLYNTYKIYGLPPGPIANPGAKAIEAALFPAKTDFLYFVSKKDTTHQFSTNIADHNQAVRKYQLRR